MMHTEYKSTQLQQIIMSSPEGIPKNRRGFTLIELLVYIVIATIIVGIAGQAFLDATKLRIRTTRLLETSMGTGDIMGYLEEDVRRMGLKASMPPTTAISSGASSSSAVGLSYASGVYWNTSSSSQDSSSFLAAPGTIGSVKRLDTITFRTAIFSSGSCSGWEEVQYSVDASSQLNRKSTLYTLANVVSSSASSTVMVNNVTAFEVQYGVWQLDSTIYYAALQADCATTVAGTLPAPNIACLGIVGSPSTSPVLATTGNAQVAILPPGVQFDLKMQIGSTEEKFDSLQGGATYRVQFGVASNDSAYLNYRPDLDYMGVRIVNSAGTALVTGIPAFLFYSGTDKSFKNRVFDMTPTETVLNSTLQFRFQTRSGSSGMDSAAFTFDSVRVSKIAQSQMNWQDGFTSAKMADKRLVKSVKITISVDVKGTVSSMTRVIPVPNNGV